MKQHWLTWSAKLDAMTLRERVMVFGAATAAILFLSYTMSLEPLLLRQKVLLAQINQQQNQIGGIDSEIAQKAQAFVADPDAATHARLAALRIELGNAGAALMAVQKGLVAPEKMAAVLEHLLRANGKLRLISLKTLAVAGMSEANGTAAPEATPKPRELLYRHGVEVVLQGSYLDMVNYMDALEALPTQLFWGQAKLDAGQYPNSRLTLTLYTLSLDPTWMKL